MKYSKEDRLFLRGIYRKVGKAVITDELIKSGDRILVAVSGGKDSLAMLNIMAERLRSSAISYELLAAHIRSDAAMYKTDEKYLESFCKSLNVRLFCETIEVNRQKGENRPMCFICSWCRRKRLFEIARERGCNKIALGHHRDDAIVTLLMGMFYNGTISGIPAKLSLFGGEIELIRPMILVSEAEIRRFAQIKSFVGQEKECPYENRTKRAEIEHLIGELEEKNPEIRDSIFASMSNIKQEYL